MPADCADRRGATMVEFALVAAPLMAMLIAVMQVSLTFFAQETLETTAEQTARMLVTGRAQASGMSPAQFRTQACATLPAFMKCANLMIDVQSAAAFSAVNAAPPTLTFDSAGNVTNQWVFQPGTADQITVARIMYVWDVSSGPLGFDLSTMSRARRLLISTSVFKTEPYQ